MIRMLSDKKGETYDRKLKDVGLTTLKERRRRGDLIETFKTMKGLNDVSKEEWFEFSDSDQTRHTRANTIIENGKTKKSQM